MLCLPCFGRSLNGGREKSDDKRGIVDFDGVMLQVLPAGHDGTQR